MKIGINCDPKYFRGGNTFRSISFLHFKREQCQFDLVVGDIEGHLAYDQDYLTRENKLVW